MTGYYTIKQGDYLPSIAKQFGFSDYRTIWDDPRNAELKEQRENPNVLFPGDFLYIPDRSLRVETRHTDARHKFVLHRPAVRLRLVLEDFLERPIANAQCDLVLEGEVFHITTDGGGKIEQPIRPDTRSALLIIHDAQTPYDGEQIPIQIGYLDPVDETSGQLARLDNLGFFAGDADQFESAVEEFQCDNGLAVDGICGPITKAKLTQVHGC
jgi:Putative peptidoglycan binding domain/LysM domain